jgi:hypothetical protein
MRRAAVVALSIALHGCVEPQARQVTLPVSIQVLDGDGQALANVPILVGSRVIARSGPQGTVRTQLSGPEGARLELGATCPDTYQLQGPAPALILRDYRSLDGEAGIAVTLTCGRMLKLVALAVRASLVRKIIGRRPGMSIPVADLPVLLDGRQVAVTDINGVAHVAMRVVPRSKLEFVLATDREPFTAFQPQNPSRKIVVQDGDELATMDQTFLREVTPARPPPQHRITVLRGRHGEVDLGAPGAAGR